MAECGSRTMMSDWGPLVRRALYFRMESTIQTTSITITLNFALFSFFLSLPSFSSFSLHSVSPLLHPSTTPTKTTQRRTAITHNNSFTCVSSSKTPVSLAHSHFVLTVISTLTGVIQSHPTLHKHVRTLSHSLRPLRSSLFGSSLHSFPLWIHT